MHTQGNAGLGNPRVHTDGGRKAWLSVTNHASPRVRFKAADNLLATDREEALRIAQDVRADPRTSPRVLSKTLNLLHKARALRDDD